MIVIRQVGVMVMAVGDNFSQNVINLIQNSQYVSPETHIRDSSVQSVLLRMY